MPQFLGPAQIEILLSRATVAETFLGIDVGSSCVGLAIAQHGSKVAFPLSWFKRTGPFVFLGIPSHFLVVKAKIAVKLHCL